MIEESGSRDRLLEIVGACCNAVQEPSSWPVALRLIKQATGSSAALLIGVERATGNRRLLAQDGLDGTAEALYRDELLDGAPWPAVRPPSMLNSQSAAEAPAEIVADRCRLAQRLLGSDDEQAVLRLDVGGDAYANSVLMILRPVTSPDVEETCQLLGRLRPHFARILAIGDNVARLRCFESTAIAAFDQLDVGVVLLDRDGKIILRNERAAEIPEFTEAGVARESNGEINGTGYLDADTLRLLAGVRTPRNGSHHGGEPIMRGGHKTPYQIRFQSLADPASAPPGTPVVMLLVNADGPTDANRTIDQLRRLYGLTPAESKLATALAAGKSLGDVAQEFHISKYTVRAQLRQIFAKTDTHRQAELVKLLLSPPQSVA